MLMPGRRGALVSGGWAEGTSGAGLPQSLTINSRDASVGEYKASQEITFEPGFSSPTGDAFLAEITQGDGTTGGSGQFLASGGYRYGFNGKEWDNEVKGEGAQQDYGMRIYDPRLGRFLSVDPLSRQYVYYTPYQFAGNMPIAATDLDGAEPKVSMHLATITKDRTAIEIQSSINIKIQLINLSAVPDANINLQNIALNLSSDLSAKLSNRSTSVMELPFVFHNNGNQNRISEVAISRKNRRYSVTYDTYVTADVSVVNDISKVEKDAWIFAIVDQVNDVKGKDVSGRADVVGGKVAIGEVNYFKGGNAYTEGRTLVMHETLHLLGATDTYSEGEQLPGTKTNDNIMYFLSPFNKRQLTPDQIVQQIMWNTVGSAGEIFKPTPYKQPSNPNSNLPTQQQLKNFIQNNAKAAKLTN